MLFLGIDPGANGGIAVIADIGGGVEVATHKMPDQPTDLLALLGSYFCDESDWYGVCEKVGANRGKGDRRQGASSMFTFGRGFGRIETALLACGVPHEFVTPQVWQAVYGLRRTEKAETDTAKKNRHKAAVTRLFPKVKVAHWNADAILLAEFGRRTYRARYGKDAG